MARPSINTYPSYSETYIKLVEEDDIKSVFKNQKPKVENFLNSITEEKSLYKYAEGKWTIKEALQHLIDTERIFCYRALAFARKEKNILSPFDEKNYAANSHANNRSWKELTEEFLAMRKSNEILFGSFSEEDLNTLGKASDYEVTVLALGYMIVGHVTHHMNIIRERYIGV